MSLISDNLQAVHAALAATARQCGRSPDSVQLLAVSKTFPADAMRVAYAAGQIAFGENYVQEALKKIAELQDLPLQWHFIGPIQSNKTRAIAEHFAWVHSVEREKIAERLAAQRPAHLPALNVCIQVNLSAEASKSGVAPAELLPLARSIARLPRLRLRGLMAVPEATQDVQAQRAAFAQLRGLRDELSAAGIVTDTLSMGMSQDFAAAIAEGSNMLRIGSAIFGKRTYAN